MAHSLRGIPLWLAASLYFGSYAPFSAITKKLSSGWGTAEPISGATLLPISTIGSFLIMVTFVFGSGWWRSAHQTRGKLRLPIPTLATIASGVSTSLILLSATLAYTFEGVSIVFVMLLMRGGVLVLAPCIDGISGRKPHWFSWLGLLLSGAALVVVFFQRGGYTLTVMVGIDIGVYLLAYFVRLQLMSKKAKTKNIETTKRYFVEEQLVILPASIGLLAILALLGQGEFMLNIRAGFTDHWNSGLVLPTLIMGGTSQLVGIFGTLIFLDHRENSFAVPVNRSVSILAGLAAQGGLYLWFSGRALTWHEFAAACLVLLAVLVLSFGPWLEERVVHLHHHH